MKIKTRRGQVVLVALLFTSFLLVSASSLINYVTLGNRAERYSVASAQALALAEAGIDQAVYSLNQNGSYSGETNTSLPDGTFVTTVSTVNSSTKRITSTGYAPNKIAPKAVRTVQATISTNSQIVAFHYGVQVGNGGFSMDGGSVVNGSIYANGNIIATKGVTITGSAIAADPIATTTDQSNNSPLPINVCTSSTCITFGNSPATQDFAQSFKISSQTPLNNVQFYIKKVGNPSDETVRIVNDNGGSPGTDLLMTATLSSSQITSSFGWVTVTLPSTPVLDPSDTYWMVIDGNSNSSKYYSIGANQGGYGNGVAKVGQYGGSWSSTSPSGLDGYFQLYLGGGTSEIGGSTDVTGVDIGTTGSDEAWAHSVQGATVTGPLYCQVGSDNNEACNTTQSDPSPQPMPVSDNNIQDWKNEASAGGVIDGDETVGSSGATLGPKEITGNLIINGGGTLDVTGTLWVEGNITVSNGAKVKLDSTYGANDGTIVSDGYVTVKGGSSFAGSGTTGSYPFIVTTSACPAAPGCNGNNAIYLTGGAGAVALIAQNGTIEVDGGSSLKAATANQIVMTGGATLTYDSGLINANFSSGPGGSWAFIPGTYAITQ